MDPLVNMASVDAFFDTPDAGGFDSGISTPEAQAGDYGMEATTFYDPKAQTPDVQAPQVDAPAQTIDYAVELATLRQQNTELALYKPLAEMIQRNPQFLKAVESSLGNAQTEVPKDPVIERPTVPSKPANYDFTESQVPGTESFKYREAMEQYPLAMAEYFDKRETVREQTAQKTQQAYQNRIAEQEAYQSLSNELTTKYGYKPDQVQDFIQTMNDPSSRSLANLVALHGMHKQNRGANVAGATKAALKNVPLPVGVVGGNGSGQAAKQTDSDSFNIGLMSARRI